MNKYHIKALIKELDLYESTVGSNSGLLTLTLP